MEIYVAKQEMEFGKHLRCSLEQRILFRAFCTVIHLLP